MLRILRDQIWQFVGALIGLLALAVAIWIFIIERPVKQLQVVVLSSAPLVNIDPEIADQIEVSYAGEPIENIAFVDVRLENNGNQPITFSSECVKKNAPPVLHNRGSVQRGCGCRLTFTGNRTKTSREHCDSVGG